MPITTPRNFPPKDSWSVRVPKSFVAEADLDTVRAIVRDADMMVERHGEKVFDVSGFGEMPAWAQPFASVDQ